MNQELPYEKHSKMLLGMKRYREALLVIIKWVESQPNNASAWFYKAFAETNAHQPSAALHSIDKALSLKPDNALMQAQKAQILGVVGRSKECLGIIDQLLSLSGLTPGLLHQIGSTLNNIGEHVRAVALFEKVRRDQPDNTANLVSLGTAYHILNRSEEAAEVQLAALKLEPDNYRAYWLLGQMQKASPASNHVELFDRVLTAHPGVLQARICLNFALAKQYEELDGYDDALRHLECGSGAVLEHTPYDQERDETLARSITSSFGRAFCETPVDGCNSDAPIFIVGMPRTGTTLLEQILTTYTGVETAGELHHFTHLLNRACTQQNPQADIGTIYEGAIDIDWRALGEDYISAASLHVGDSPYFIDKYPLNFMMVGPILKALPNARIINLQRNPMDTCFSNYKLLYRLGSALHSYNLETMADYYCRYREMMRHWHDCLPGRILDVQYERMVTEPEQETRRVAAFLGLDWNPECLDFYKSGAAVATASVAQVRRPINTGSLYKWRKFEQGLEPLHKALRRRGVDIEARFPPARE